MTEKLYNAFVDATHNVLNLMLNIADISEHPTDDFKCDEEVDISIGIVGDLTGEVIYRFPVSTSINIVNLMSGMEVKEVDVFVTSAISEIANIISGNVLTAISSDSDMKCDILPPVKKSKLDEDEEYEMKTSCCITTTIGEICLEIRLNRGA